MRRRSSSASKKVTHPKSYREVGAADITPARKQQQFEPQIVFKMVTKSKLKMALVAEKQVDFKKEHQKKMSKKARKEQKIKKPTAAENEDEDEDEDEEGIRELMELDDEESGDEHRSAEVNRADAIPKFWF